MGKIKTDGLYDLPMDDYHGDCCDGPSLSASRLWTLIAECPAIFWESSPLNPNRVPDDSTKSLDVGRAAHALVLGEPEFAASFVVCPHDRLNANPGKQWHDEWKRQVAAGEETRTLIRADDFEKVKQMAAAQRRSPQVARAFADGKPERSLIWRDPETGVWLKSRPDWLPDDPATGWLIDYKTAATLRPREFSMNAFKYGYHVQAAMQIDAVRAVLGVKVAGIAHVVQEKASPFLAELRLFTPEQIEFGRQEYRRALRLFAKCWEAQQSGKPERIAWPGYTTEPQYIETPIYIAKEMENSNGHSASQPDDTDPGRYLRAG